MKRFKLVASTVMLALLIVTNARAQVSIDIAKITCAQFGSFSIADPRYLAIWLSGYYNGTRDNSVIDTQIFNENYIKLREFCIINPQFTVVQAIERLFNPAR
jgi:acid stress chaperone HdeB